MALYAAFAVLYGICETLNGNWSQLDMTTEVGASTTVAAVALTTFWAMVTVGRVVFAAIQQRFPATRAYRVLPLVLAVAFVAISAATAGLVIAAYQVGYGIAAFGAGPLQDAGVSLPAIFAIGAAAAAVLAVLSFVITRPSHAVAAVQPRPA